MGGLVRGLGLGIQPLGLELSLDLRCRGKGIRRRKTLGQKTGPMRGLKARIVLALRAILSSFIMRLTPLDLGLLGLGLGLGREREEGVWILSLVVS